MIANIVHAPLVTAESFADATGVFVPEVERAAVARAVPKRQAEYFTVRHLARRAMGTLGVPGAEQMPILKGARGAPTWPNGVVGSMTHCTGYRGAVVGYSDHVRSIGIDAEPHTTLPAGVLPSVSIPDEREWLASAMGEYKGIHLDKVLFCAKETTYKAWFPITGRWLGFEDAHVTISVDESPDGALTTGTFESRILIDGTALEGDPIHKLAGKWCIDNGLVVAAIAVSHSSGIPTSGADANG
ncbi:4'-phosphopantetheinyl transferase superfamily protein [Hoyosella rhizosphaerae]|uniref:4'-phosphopantetheinyl transferase n=1 Tax=Hoyosella rhizosphaerae TaxID=1755582 RepID=A0A916U4L1_9ACTN|nr:4'-phosphopantetheinyl transferase superfamily protein [Hoyosella rhizosphaerae]MBN4926299.1 4'-phosphopantetheinyl transferase superfamily protein [Hoyosella rhizosphaerae]GGC60435.1 4'-phosphopantetheinyl transferase [Hoyosella rhizosphaerae]